MRKMLGVGWKSTRGGNSLALRLSFRPSSRSPRSRPASSSSFAVVVANDDDDSDGDCVVVVVFFFFPFHLHHVFGPLATLRSRRSTVYSDIGIACTASSLSASFDPLNLAGGRPAVSRKLVKSRTYRVKERREDPFRAFPQTFLSFPHCLVAFFAEAAELVSLQSIGETLARTTKGTTCARAIARSS